MKLHLRFLYVLLSLIIAVSFSLNIQASPSKKAIELFERFLIARSQSRGKTIFNPKESIFHNYIFGVAQISYPLVLGVPYDFSVKNSESFNEETNLFSYKVLVNPNTPMALGKGQNESVIAFFDYSKDIHYVFKAGHHIYAEGPGNEVMELMKCVGRSKCVLSYPSYSGFNPSISNSDLSEFDRPLEE